jgi:hypothetical protein
MRLPTGENMVTQQRDHATLVSGALRGDVRRAATADDQATRLMYWPRKQKRRPRRPAALSIQKIASAYRHVHFLDWKTG